jgi:RNA ligase (TIGR02306 family)
MSSFECNVVRVKIMPHDNADSLEIAQVGGYQSIVKKGQFQDGELAVYVPEQALLPYSILKDMGLWDLMNNRGTLTSAAGNRVKAIRLRGVLSQGLLIPGGTIPAGDERLILSSSYGIEVTDPYPTVMIKRFAEGENAAEFLGIVKWEPAIPKHMQGKVAGADLYATISYDFENLKKFPTLFDDGQEVVITEKLHGTLLQFGLIPHCIWEDKSWAEKCPDIGLDGFKGIVTSKGQGAKGLMLDPNDADNLYVNTVIALDLWNKLELARTEILYHPSNEPLFGFGEIFGSQQTVGGLKGIQDLTYGQTEVKFRVFDFFAGVRNSGFYLSQGLFDQLARIDGLFEAVPELYRGPFSSEVVANFTDGNTTLTNLKHIREGVVIKATNGVRHPSFGRRIAKSVSAYYLLRKGETTELS